ncbi:hypothetical protein [Pleionea mediterranea]|uniref:Uncharacterized protein n=1 Tax=Pleionea mediterranea TaxID=523701 RepID=A0A316FE78_9GAMM|nr:hypothetical protein [Pleionea mediterranea]PWK46372.1 hypothetical protein C8D97_11357 [Pleionea mediterranea]
MKYLMKLCVIVCSVFCLMACKPSISNIESGAMTQPTPKIVIYDKKKKVKRGVVSDPEDAEKIVKMIEQREKVLLKRLPIFKYEIEIANKGKNIIWLFSKDGIIQRKGAKGSELHQIKKPELIAKYIK